MLIESDGRLYPVERKKSVSLSREALHDITALEKLEVNVGPGAVICMAPQLSPLQRTVMAVPVWIV